jgi:NAD(P)-dependent dehydrogenase (short-subunit alcohol dehydrogenase family)
MKNMLDGKTILITGGARRIGRIMSLGVAKAGGNVLIHHNNSSKQAAELKNEIQNMGQEADIIQADFSDPEASHKIFKEIFSSQTIFGLVHNASIFDNLSWEDTQLHNWNQHININLTAPFFLSQLFSKSIPESGKGRIINILDWRALRPGADHFPYTISKAALAALTKSMAVALSPKITVNGIALGAILPPSDGTSANNILSDLQLPRWAETSEVEETLLFLLTGPEYITGEIIHLDGGRHLT